MSSRLAAGAALVLVGLGMMCSGPQRIAGDPVTLGNGKMWTWAEYSPPGTATRIGITLTESVLSNLPVAYDAVQLPLPAGFAVPPYEVAVVGWDPMGHGPSAYGVPHLDFHFYFVAPEEQEKVEPGTDSFPVPQQYRPPDYRALLLEPDVGVHWGDTLAPEMRGQPFTATFVYGFFQGRMTFLEPMVGTSYLQERQSMSRSVKQPGEVQLTGMYPRGYSIKYDPKARTYTIALEGLTLREAK